MCANSKDSDFDSDCAVLSEFSPCANTLRTILRGTVLIMMSGRHVLSTSKSIAHLNGMFLFSV